MTRPPTTAELLLRWDRRRARSQQRELGMSELGGCQRRAGYRLAGTEPSNEGSSVQAVMGTAVHAAVEEVFHEMQTAGELPPEDLVEEEVRYAGILGHLDRYSAHTRTVHDTKTTSQRWLEHIRLHGASEDHLWQVHLYGAALISRGLPVETLVIDYLARDTGEDHQVIMDFDPKHVRDALAWLDAVRGTDVELLNRKYQPDSPFCQHCPFRDTCWDGGVPGRDPRSVLYIEHPDGAHWALQLERARRMKAEAAELEAEARGALDALRPWTDRTTEPVDVGHPTKNLQWVVSKPKPKLDTKAAAAEFEAAGVAPPMKPGNPATTLKFVPKENPT